MQNVAKVQPKRTMLQPCPCLLIAMLQVSKFVVQFQALWIFNGCSRLELHPRNNLFNSDFYFLSIKGVLKRRLKVDVDQKQPRDFLTGISSTCPIHAGTCLGLNLVFIISRISAANLRLNLWPERIFKKRSTRSSVSMPGRRCPMHSISSTLDKNGVMRL